MNEGEKLYYSISEVSQLLNVNASLLRFWEKEFAEFIKPRKNRNGKRMFTASDIETLKKIYFLTKEKGFTLTGAKNSLKSKGKTVDDKVVLSESLKNMQSFLLELRQIINNETS